MNILVLSSIYPADDIASTYTPVVHYFAREWVNAGHRVKVVNSYARFPKIFYIFAKILGEKFLSSNFGYTVMDKCPPDRKYILDGVEVSRFCISKFLPHRRYSRKAILDQVDKIKSYCAEDNFVPDVIIGHWLNPQLELINELKKIYKCASTALTLHDNAQSVIKLYPYEWRERIAAVDKIGARSRIPMLELRKTLLIPESKTYLCHSGIPSKFIEATNRHNFSEGIKNFAFVGTLFKRKYPEALLKALLKLPDKDFKLTYAGSGECFDEIRSIAKENGVERNVEILGRVSREKIREVLENCDCFAMISKNEVYGLVYLEAMALGCIVIASKSEGFDGIIKDGENGFLCEAGNVEELAQIFKRLRHMNVSKILEISAAAMRTAKEMSDEKCAAKYLYNILQK